ncbi:hypothetical protein RND81_14G116900 [Saponaria officinalis]|uniref:Uncharacterized protein n=1 Tax=Saponaria officinalis TaxID=3572 RepID=A0AAW1GWV6_SAPOF
MQGIVTGIGNLSKLSYFDTSFNNLNLDLSFGFSPLFQLDVFNVHSCKISAVFPQWLRNQTQISGLDLSYTGISGQLPKWLWNMTSIRYLQLSGNQLTGLLPSHVVCDGCNLDTFLELREIIKGITEVFGGTEGIHSMIDLSSNHLVGKIPEEITNISKLMALNLSNNRLTGEIPKEIGNLKLLESLDLSNNNLSGTIPQSLSVLSWLSSLNLSNNKLYGPIPTGSQLQILDDPSIYAGNSGLCGFPLTDVCSKTHSPRNSTDVDNSAGGDDVEEDDKHDKMWFYLVIMSGVATGFWVVIGTLVVKESWRRSYFRFVEETADRIYVWFKVRVMNRLQNRLQD